MKRLLILLFVLLFFCISCETKNDNVNFYGGVIKQHYTRNNLFATRKPLLCYLVIKLPCGFEGEARVSDSVFSLYKDGDTFKSNRPYYSLDDDKLR